MMHDEVNKSKLENEVLDDLYMNTNNKNLFLTKIPFIKIIDFLCFEKFY
jgi:hypothetical protein